MAHIIPGGRLQIKTLQSDPTLAHTVSSCDKTRLKKYRLDVFLKEAYKLHCQLCFLTPKKLIYTKLMLGAE